MNKTSAWIKAFRLRTLPLAFSGIGMGGFLSASYGKFDLEIFLLCIATTLLLQILSNLANDYGDFQNGADLTGRIGPMRAVQSGVISPNEMKMAIILFTVLSFCTGIYLLYRSAALESLNAFGFFLFLGIIAIVASIKYTAGKNPYGYAGLGDVSVMIFFGWAAVAGSFFLQTGTIYAEIFLPATGCGFFATGVLNINNIRDIESDKIAGKITIPVRLGRKKAIVYHIFLLSLGLLSALTFVLLSFRSIWQLLFLLTVPIFMLNIVKVSQSKPEELNPYLKQLALTSLLFVICFGMGLLISVS